MSNTPLKATLRARAELAAVVLLALAVYALAATFELHERMAAWLLRFERWQIDEVPLVLVVLAAGLAWYAMRRQIGRAHV